VGAAIGNLFIDADPEDPEVFLLWSKCQAL